MTLEKIHRLQSQTSPCDSEQGEEIKIYIVQKKAENIAFLNSCMRKEVNVYIITSLLPTKTEPPLPPIKQPPPCCRKWRRDTLLHLLHLWQDPLRLKTQFVFLFYEGYTSKYGVISGGKQSFPGRCIHLSPFSSAYLTFPPAAELRESVL